MHTDGDIDPDEPSNISFLLAFEWTQAVPQSFRLNDVACQNMLVMSVTLDTSHFEMSPLNAFALRNIAVIVVTLDTSHFEMSPLNDVARQNMLLMSITLETSHFERSSMNVVA